MTEQNDNKEEYEVEVKCLNCELGNYGRQLIRIPKGQKVADTPCPNCGCTDLV